MQITATTIVSAIAAVQAVTLKSTLCIYIHARKVRVRVRVRVRVSVEGIDIHTQHTKLH